MIYQSLSIGQIVRYFCGKRQCAVILLVTACKLYLMCYLDWYRLYLMLNKFQFS